MAKPPDDEPPKARRGRPRKNPPKERIDECNALMDAEKWEKLRGEANRLITDYPKSHVGWHFRGVSWDRLGEYQKAINDYNEAINMKADHIPSLVERSVIWHRFGRLDDALKDCEAALKLAPSDAQLLANCGNIRAYSGNIAEAIADLNRASD